MRSTVEGPSAARHPRTSLRVVPPVGEDQARNGDKRKFARVIIDLDPPSGYGPIYGRHW